jgi:putative transport protein
MTLLQRLHESSPVAHDLLIISFAVLLGIGLGNIRIAGIKLGVAGVLFAGLFTAHFGFSPGVEVSHFLKDFGLVLFVFALGMQIGPGFFASLRRRGRVLNGYAFALVLGGALTALAGGWLCGMSPSAVAGLFAGATTNTPALGAAQQALSSAGVEPLLVTLPALSYAATYPLAIVGIILSLTLLRLYFKIDVNAEAAAFQREQGVGAEPLERITLQVQNPNLDGVPISSVPGLEEAGVIISRHRAASGDEVRAATAHTLLRTGDLVMVVGHLAALEKARLIIGIRSSENLMLDSGNITFRRVIVTNQRMLGKSVHDLALDSLHNVTVTRVSRGDLIFTALPHLRLQFGDILQIVGDEVSIDSATKALGNEVQMIAQTKFAAIFAGILLGVLLGLYPFRIEGLPAPVRLGLAGGPLVMAILLSHLGRLGPMVMHMPMNANRALRELGIILFLANVGLLSGENFAETVFSARGLQWVFVGIVVTMLPLLVVGYAARRFHKLNFMSLSGLLSGGMTDPPALAFATLMARSDAPAVAYASVYPLTMLLRIVAAQIIVQMG